MKRLKQCSPEDHLNVHRQGPLRVYTSDFYHGPRVVRAREVVCALLENMGKADSAHKFRKIVELGCGAADISGFFCWGHNVEVWECSSQALNYLGKTYPWMTVHSENLELAEPIDSDLLIMCEILEHVQDPVGLAGKWMPKAQYALISSPLDGDLTCDSSGGEHMWSFNRKDFGDIVNAGNHVLVHKDLIPCGSYNIQLMLTQRKESQ